MSQVSQQVLNDLNKEISVLYSEYDQRNNEIYKVQICPPENLEPMAL